MSKQDLVRKMASVMQADFSVIKTGIGTDGRWQAKPLEIEVFIRASESALHASGLLEMVEEQSKVLERCKRLFQGAISDCRTIENAMGDYPHRLANQIKVDRLQFEIDAIDALTNNTREI